MTGDWRTKSGEYPSSERIPAAPLAKALPPPLPRDLNREDAENVRGMFVQACEWWLREHESSIHRLAERMRMSHSYLLEMRKGTRPLQIWMFARMPRDLWREFSALLDRHLSESRIVVNGY